MLFRKRKDKVKHMKKITALVLMLASILFLSTQSVSASTYNVYKEILEEYNKLYDVSLEYVDVSKGTDINEYRDFVFELARQERATQDFMKRREAESRKQDNILVYNNRVSRVIPNSTVSRVVTVTKNPWSASYMGETAYNVTCIYTCYTNTASTPIYTVGNPLSVNVSMESNAFFVRYFTLDSWSSKLLDTGRTLGITAKGTVHQFFHFSPPVEVRGVTLYTEFGWTHQ